MDVSASSEEHAQLSPPSTPGLEPAAERTGAFWIAAVFALVGAVWMLLIDRVVVSVVPDAEVAGRLTAEANTGFVVASAGLVYALVRRYGRRLTASELRARRSELYYRQLFDGVADAVFVVGLDGDGQPDAIVEANRSAADRLGYASDELRRMSLRDLLDGSGETPFGSLATRAPTEGPARFQSALRARDGRRVAMDVHARLIDLEGRQAVLAIARDMTETRRLAADRERVQAQIAQVRRMQAIGSLVGSLAHDFNNLLGVIKGNVDLLAMTITGRGAQVRPLERIRRAVERAEELVRQIGVLRSGRIAEADPFDINKLVTDCVTMLDRTLGTAITTKRALGRGLPGVRGDRGQIEQVLTNLAVNARDAMPDGGLLEFRTDVVTLGEGDPDLHAGMAPGTYVVLSVTDAGVGISPDDLDRIFDPYFTTKEEGKGTGLGLATVFGIVDRHGGWIAVASRLGQGTTFRVYLPAAEPTPSSTTQA